MEQLDNSEIVDNFEKSRKLENHVKGEVSREENAKIEGECEGEAGEVVRVGEGGGDVVEGGVTKIKGE